MSDFVSPLDDRYIKVGRAAELMAKANPCTTRTDIMDLFKRALFSGEFDSTLDVQYVPGCEPMQIEVNHPRLEVTADQLALKTDPRRHYEMNRNSITSVLYCDGALPGDQEVMDRYLYIEGKQEAVYSHLVKIAFDEFPEIGQQRLADIYISKGKLKGWLISNGQEVPDFLADAPTPPQPTNPDFELYDFPAETLGSRRENGRAQPQDAEDAANDDIDDESANGRGRPELAGWKTVVDAARALKANDPDMLNKVIAHEAREIALRQFREIDVPSEKTIVRRMKDILLH
jgi:hypothetical protein